MCVSGAGQKQALCAAEMPSAELLIQDHRMEEISSLCVHRGSILLQAAQFGRLVVCALVLGSWCDTQEV